jgi:hypothetical protein
VICWRCGARSSSGNCPVLSDLMSTYPKVKCVSPLIGRRLLVTFVNGDVRIYDCERLIVDPAFRLLSDEGVFRSVQADPYGYGVVWSDSLDLSESELWLNGAAVAV